MYKQDVIGHFTLKKLLEKKKRLKLKHCKKPLSFSLLPRFLQVSLLTLLPFSFILPYF